MALSEEEAALYDRQIRLWGLDAQKRMRNSRVLIAGLSGLGVEVAKNIVLSGVKSVTLLDDKDVTLSDLTAQFYLGEESIGQNRATASLPKVQALNPMVLVSADTEPIQSKTAEFFTQFDLVCLVGLQHSYQTTVQVNQFCRDQGVKFISGAVFGSFGYFFIDFQNHSYTEDVAAPPTQGKPNETAASSTESTVRQNTTNYIDYKTAINIVDWSTPERQKRLKTTPKFLFALLAILHSPEKDFDSLIKARSIVLDYYKVSPTFFTEEYMSTVASNVGAELSPTAAIVGGIFAQEVQKGISGKDQPLNNFLLFDGVEGAGYVDNVAP